MKSPNNHQRLWFYRGLALLVTAVLVHLLAVWAAPRLIMRVLMHGASAQTMNMHNQAAFPPPVTAQSRSVVLPSPDLLYCVCVFDVSKGPVRVTANPQLSTYWSIALYASNSDNFFVVNDRSAGKHAVDLWLTSGVGGPSTNAVPAGSQVVVVPSATGFLLMRVVTGDYEAEKSLIEPARRSLSCTPT